MKCGLFQKLYKYVKDYSSKIFLERGIDLSQILTHWWTSVLSILPDHWHPN